MRATIGKRSQSTIVPVIEVSLTSSGLRTAWLAPLADEEQMALLGHFSDRHAVLAVSGRGKSAKVSLVSGVPGFVDHLHAALARLPPPYVLLDLERGDPLGRQLVAVPKALRFTMDPKVVPKLWRIGWRGPSGPTHACDLRRASSGDVLIENAQVNLSEIERRMLLAHFRVARAFRAGGERDGRDVTVMQVELPGTLEHFVGCVYALPVPFTHMP